MNDDGADQNIPDPPSPDSSTPSNFEDEDLEADANTIQKDLRDQDSVDALLAKELNQLSVQERDRINEEIHGIQKAYPNETPEEIRASLEKLALELDSLPSKQAYDASRAFPESYINTDEFRLIFLRCEYFDARKAAVRMSKYLDLIQWAFGERVLERDICLSDFDEECSRTLKTGYLQILPGRDRSGRRVLGQFFFMIASNQSRIDRIRIMTFLTMRLAKNDIDVQRRGIVGVLWTHGFVVDDLKRRSWVYRRMIPAMPIRLCATHICLPDVSNHIAKMASALHVLAVGSENRKRVRIHNGSPTECLYKLQTFGILSLQMPINTNTGKIKNVNHLKWIEIQKKRDEAFRENREFNGIECPRQRDILFGRGWPKMSHPGNAVFRNMIDANLEKYNNAGTKRDKTMIAWSIVCELRDSGARFLREDAAGWWEQVSNEVARQKVSIGFRDIRKARQKSSSKSGDEGDSVDMQTDSKPPATSSKRKAGSPDSKDAPDGKRAASTTNVDSNETGDEDASRAFLNMDGSSLPSCQPCQNPDEGADQIKREDKT